MEQLDSVVRRIQTSILAELLSITNYERVDDFVETLRIINQEFEERYSIGLDSYKDLLKSRDYPVRLPIRTE